MVLRVLNSLEARMPWTLANRVMKRAGLDGSQGWDGAHAKYSAADHPKAEGFLKGLLRQHALCGEKMTKFYAVEDAVKAELLEAINGLTPADHDFSKHYRLVMSEAELMEQTSKPVLVSVEKTDDGVGAIFAQTIKLTLREQIPIGEVFNDPDNVRERYDEVIGLKFKAVQLFNVIWVPHHDGMVEVRTDFPKGMRQELSHEIQSQFKAIANSLVEGSPLEQTIDLFPLISSMYEKKGEGTVVELSFKTSTASIKHEKMRRTRLSLRDELYHKGGKDALGTKIEPFKVSIRWEFEHEGQAY